MIPVSKIEVYTQYAGAEIKQNIPPAPGYSSREKQFQDDDKKEEKDFLIKVDSRSEEKPKLYDRHGKISDKTMKDDENDPDAVIEQKGKDGQSLTDEEIQEVRELKIINTKVRAHEMAHLAAGGDLVRGGMTFTYQKGPDGVMYAVSGEVGIDISEENTPARTVQKMQRVQAAALAPADPSSQDRAVASTAARKATAARMEMAQEREVSTPSAQDETTTANQAEENGQVKSNQYQKNREISRNGRSLNLIA